MKKKCKHTHECAQCIQEKIAVTERELEALRAKLPPVKVIREYIPTYPQPYPFYQYNLPIVIKTTPMPYMPFNNGNTIWATPINQAHANQLCVAPTLFNAAHQIDVRAATQLT